MHDPPSSACIQMNTSQCESDVDVCGSHASCQQWDEGHVCFCEAGFDGFPPVLPCVDVNECEDSPGICGLYSDCQH